MHQGSSNASGSQTATSTPPDCATRKLVAANPPNFVNSVQAALQADFNPVASPLPPIPSFVANKPPSKSSLFDLFPSLEASQLLEIVRHEFRPADLYQLNSRFRDIDRPDDSKGRSSANDYPSLHSLINPLFTYFRVLSAFAASSGDAEATRVVGDGSTRYYEHLHDLHQRYEWSAVVEYHLQYHLIRRHEMANGDYSGWGQTNADLMNRFLVHPPLPLFPVSSPLHKPPPVKGVLKDGHRTPLYVLAWVRNYNEVLRENPHTGFSGLRWDVLRPRWRAAHYEFPGYAFDPVPIPGPPVEPHLYYAFADNERQALIDISQNEEFVQAWRHTMQIKPEDEGTLRWYRAPIRWKTHRNPRTWNHSQVAKLCSTVEV